MLLLPHPPILIPHIVTRPPHPLRNQLPPPPIPLNQRQQVVSLLLRPLTLPVVMGELPHYETVTTVGRAAGEDGAEEVVELGLAQDGFALFGAGEEAGKLGHA